MPSEEGLMGLAAHMGMPRVLFQSKNTPDVIAFSHQRSSITAADRDDWASQGKKNNLKMNFKTKNFAFGPSTLAPYKSIPCA